MILSMALYGIVYLLTSVLAEGSVRLKSRKAQYVCMILVVAVPSFLAAIRDHVGTDWINYYYLYEKTRAGAPTTMEPGYKALMLLLDQLGADYTVLCFVVMALTILFAYMGIVYFEDSLSVGMAMFVFLMCNYQLDLNMMRQGISIAIVFYALRFLLENKLLKYLVLVLLASSIHISALIMIPFYWIFRLFSNRQSLGSKFLVYAVMIVLVLNMSYILEWLVDVVPAFEQYSIYLGQRIEFGLGVLILQVPYLLPGLFFYRKLSRDNPRFRFYVDLMVMGIIFWYAGNFGIYYLNRFSYYFTVPAQALLSGTYVKAMKAYRQRWVTVLLVAYVIAYWFYYFGLKGASATVPFTNIFGISFPF